MYMWVCFWTFSVSLIYLYKISQFWLVSIQFSHSVMSNSLWTHELCSTPGFLVHYQLLELAQTHVHRIGYGIQPSHPIVLFSSCLQSFPASGSFPMSQFFTSGVQSIGASALASVLPMNIQDWFPLGWTGLVSLQYKGLSRVFSNTTVQKHQFFSAQLLYGPTLTSTHDYWKNHSFD